MCRLGYSVAPHSDCLDSALTEIGEVQPGIGEASRRHDWIDPAGRAT